MATAAHPTRDVTAPSERIVDALDGGPITLKPVAVALALVVVADSTRTMGAGVGGTSDTVLLRAAAVVDVDVTVDVDVVVVVDGAVAFVLLTAVALLVVVLPAEDADDVVALGSDALLEAFSVVVALETDVVVA